MKILFPFGDGIAIIHPTGELPIEDVIAKDLPAGVRYVVVDDDDLPADRLYRDAWTVDFDAETPAVTIDATKAAVIDRALAVPAEVTRAQAKMALARTPLDTDPPTTLLDAATAAVASSDAETKIWFADANTWRRDHPAIAAIGTTLGLTSADIDALFVAAAAI